MKSRIEIFADIHDEREYQVAKWGDKFDDQNTINDWVTYLSMYAAQGATINLVSTMDEATERFRQSMVKVAAIAVAALETIERNGHPARRHYDPEAADEAD